MILKGSQRGIATQLARHLMNMHENEHIELHELRGISCERLIDALSEAEAIAKGTRCYQFMFSLSLNPPPDENVSIETFETVEQRLGLNDLPRAIVFHEKEGRRHAHAVWPRIDPETMKARTSLTHADCQAPKRHRAGRCMRLRKPALLEGSASRLPTTDGRRVPDQADTR